MIALDNADKIKGDASAGTIVDYTLHGIVGSTITQLADGQLPATMGDLYTAASAVAVTSIIVVNADAAPRTINLYLLPTGGTARRLIPKDLSLAAGSALVFDGKKICVMTSAGAIL